jgi:hypothetical protein
MLSTVVRLFRFLFLVCRDRGATSANGTIQPLVENSDGYDWNKRFCLFDIQALPFQQIKFSCSFLWVRFQDVIVCVLTLNLAFVSSKDLIHSYILLVAYWVVLTIR